MEVTQRVGEGGVMYEKGLIKIGKKMDTRTEGYDIIFGAFLPHACQEWVIGGPDQIKLLIGDLQEALKELGKGEG